MPRAQHWQELLSRRFDSPDQALMTAWVSQRAGAVLAAGAFRLGVSPNAVTMTGLAVMLAACLSYAKPGISGWLMAALLWQLGFALDCADGQLARALSRSSEFGAWLDVACDHVRQAAISLTLVYVLHTGGLSLPVAIVCCLVLHSGLSVYLHSATIMKIRTPPRLDVSGSTAYLRLLVQTGLDTPVFLLMLCVLRPFTWLLAAYIVAYGILMFLRGTALSRLRLIS